MREKSLDSRPDVFLIVLLPLAFVIVFLFATWPLLLGILVLSIGYNIWQHRRWQQWIEQVNPLFHQLIQANQGRVTPLDLAMKANFSASTAKRYLDCKAEEFGATCQTNKDSGSVYYFVTSKTLGSVFDQSEPAKEFEQQEGEGLKDESKASVKVRELAPTTPADSSIQFPSHLSERLEATPEYGETLHVGLLPPPLIQSELAKRLNVYSSTVYKRRDDPDFSEWSRGRDPDGIAWKYIAETKEFTPVLVGSSAG